MLGPGQSSANNGSGLDAPVDEVWIRNSPHFC